jgi:hypothetical protein
MGLHVSVVQVSSGALGFDPALGRPKVLRIRWVYCGQELMTRHTRTWCCIQRLCSTGDVFPA